MQATCPQCTHKITVDDARAPERAFSVKCPKCATVVKFPGRAASHPPSAPESLSAEPEAPAAPRKEIAPSEPGPSGRALILLAERAHPGVLAQVLGRAGYGVDVVDDMAEAARFLEQGIYAFVAMARTLAAAGQPETPYQRVGRMNPEARRRLFLALVGDEYKTGDSTQAFSVAADLVLNTKELGSADHLIKSTTAERSRLYQAFLDAKRRHETSAT